MTFRHESREYEVTSTEIAPKLFLAHLVGRGFDGWVYTATSAPVGKQRKTFSGMFFRSASNGEFISAIA